ncbi:hypothetical protein [Limimaricola cinnabarinus]|uniref:hypothetical protein n=1 Tax=Limimaricola cinnabarinus TaxID=1125964 RepID=UPI002FE11306
MAFTSLGAVRSARSRHALPVLIGVALLSILPISASLLFDHAENIAMWAALLLIKLDPSAVVVAGWLQIPVHPDGIRARFETLRSVFVRAFFVGAAHAT